MELNADHFRKHLDQNFTLRFGEHAITARLVEVKALSSHSLREDRSPFSILFKGPMDYVVPQQIVGVERESFDPISLFLVPLGPDSRGEEKGMLYEAVFT